VAESSGNAEFDAAALRVAQEIRFTPAIRNGVPHPVWGYFTVRFRPPGRDWVEGASAEQVQAWAESAQALAPSQVESGPSPIDGIGRLVEEAYPAALRESGVRGWLTVWFVVDTRGMPSAVRVARSSGHPELDRAGVQVAEKLRFYAARRGGQPVNAWVAYHLHFFPPAFSASLLVPGGGYAPPARTPAVDPATVDTAAVYELRQLSVPPELLNRSDAARSLAQNYPTLLRDARITGTAVVAAVIGRDGRVEGTRVESATHPEFGEAAGQVVRTMRFTPGKVGTVPVRVRVMLPVNFSISNEE
jgi:TonB family protein